VREYEIYLGLGFQTPVNATWAGRWGGAGGGWVLPFIGVRALYSNTVVTSDIYNGRKTKQTYPEALKTVA